ncbi:MAG TPA: hypothetical protein VJ385_03785 [Fibrobacteria bacterium]|nr:hypothetical protein [Fibrobacteria bacterium]
MLSRQEMDRFNRQIAEVEAYFHSEKKLHVEYVDVLSALMEALGEANPEAICGMRLPTEALIRALENRSFDAPRILGVIDDASIEAPGSLRRIHAALGRPGGTEWEILRNDKDPFPSNPCAHNEAEDIVLDLAAGGLYHDREPVYRVRRQELIRFRDKIAEKYPGIALPPLPEGI